MAVKSDTKPDKTNTPKRTGRKAPHVPGPFWIGGVAPYRPPATLTAIEAAQRAAEIRERWLPVARERAAQQRKWYPGICAWYERELTQLDAVIAAQTAPAKRQRRKRAA